MTAPSYLYTFTITVLCIVILLAYLIGAAITHRKEYLLMVGLFGVYLLSEFVRILAMLNDESKMLLNTVAVAAMAVIMLVFYFLIMWHQSGRRLHPIELWLLLLSFAGNLCLLEMPGMKNFASRIGFYIFIWGGYKLWPVRKDSTRSFAMFWLAMGISAFHVAINLLDLVIPMDKLFAVGSSFALTNIAFELMFYIIITASVVELFFVFREIIRNKREEETTPNDPVAGIAEKYGLTPREKDVFILLAEGKSAKEIAEELFISDGTVRVHTHNLYQKLGISKRSQIYQMVLDTAVGNGQEHVL